MVVGDVVKFQPSTPGGKAVKWHKHVKLMLNCMKLDIVEYLCNILHIKKLPKGMYGLNRSKCVNLKTALLMVNIRKM